MPVDRGLAEVRPAEEIGGGTGATMWLLHRASHADPSLQTAHAPQKREAGLLVVGVMFLDFMGRKFRIDDCDLQIVVCFVCIMFS